MDVYIVSPAQIRLACEAVGRPQPILYWLFKDHIISEETVVSSYLTLNISSFDESGYYVCIARNTHNTTSRSVQVTVQGEAVLSFIFKPKYSYTLLEIIFAQTHHSF